jgi:diadenosine tetraphosphate (Ap4A) HIT family hydrolase
VCGLSIARTGAVVIMTFFASAVAANVMIARRMSGLRSDAVDMSGCYVCSNNERVGDLPPREQVVVEGGWRVAHAFDSALPGGLVLVPTRHVTALHELTEAEAGVMGRLLVRLSAALREVVGCEKTYVMLFAEAHGFGHLHYHVVPRMPEFEPSQVGPQAFTFLGKDERERVPFPAQDELAGRIGEALMR